MTDATLSTISVYPVKALDGLSLDAAALGPDGGLVPDRVVALTDADGDYVNGKNERAIHRVTADYDPAAGTARLTPYVGYAVTAEVTKPSYPDDTVASGPTLVSRATLATVADWFDHTLHETRRRFRPNLVVDGDLPAFWEDRLYGDCSECVRFRLGAATLDGVGPCRRCVVPARDPDTGRETEGFTERFVDQREATLPEWSAGPRFDGAFKLTLNTRMPTASRGETLRVGDPLCVEGSVPAEQ